MIYYFFFVLPAGLFELLGVELCLFGIFDFCCGLFGSTFDILTGGGVTTTFGLFDNAS